jgi:hypothetical protein
MKRLTQTGTLIAALAIFVPIGVAQGQDTTTSQTDTASQQAVDRSNQDTTNLATPGDTTAAAQNPQGYRGMERPANVLPSDSGQAQDTSAGAVEDRVTGTYEDSAWKDTTGAAQNPAGYRGMERPAGIDSAAADTGAVTGQKTKKTSEKTVKQKDADRKKAGKKATGKKAATTKSDTTKAGANDAKAAAAAGDSVQQDSTKWGTETNRDPETQNPPGYRGMERPVNVFPADSGQARDTSAGAVEDRVTGTYEDSAWKDTTGAAQNPAGYRGMERPAGLDSASNEGTTRSPADSGQQGEASRSE